MSSRRNNGGLLARVNFPLYTLQMLTSRHVLVGGGGGSSKTGVANGFEIFELSHNGMEFIAEEVTRHETGPSVVMNCASYNDGDKTWIVAGQESHCQLYNVISKVVSMENGDATKGPKSLGKDGLRQRKKFTREKEAALAPEDKVQEIKNKDKDINVKVKKLQLTLNPGDSIQTDFSKDEALQRIVRMSLNGKCMATGGTDGHVRLWKFPQLQMLHDLKAHDKEIDDIDFSPDNRRLASIAKDGRAVLWDVETGAKRTELTWSPADSSKYAYKRCRFRRRPDSTKSTSELFILSNALTARKPSFLQLWNIERGNIVKSLSYKEALSALAVSDDGKFVAVGTMFSGSVDILIAFSLRRALRVSGAHSMFITGLEFLPTSMDSSAITSNSEAAVISISVDNRICIHSVPFRHTLPFWLVIVMIVISICGAFIFCSYFGI